MWRFWTRGPRTFIFPLQHVGRSSVPLSIGMWVIAALQIKCLTKVPSPSTRESFSAQCIHVIFLITNIPRSQWVWGGCLLSQYVESVWKECVECVCRGHVCKVCVKGVCNGCVCGRHARRACVEVCVWKVVCALCVGAHDPLSPPRWISHHHQCLSVSWHSLCPCLSFSPYISCITIRAQYLINWGSFV